MQTILLSVSRCSGVAQELVEDTEGMLQTSEQSDIEEGAWSEKLLTYRRNIQFLFFKV